MAHLVGLGLDRLHPAGDVGELLPAFRGGQFAEHGRGLGDLAAEFLQEREKDVLARQHEPYDPVDEHGLSPSFLPSFGE